MSAVLLLGVIIPGLLVVPRAVAEPATAVLSARLGLRDLNVPMNRYPGFGVTLGVRIHERLAVRLDGWMDIYPNVGGWSATGGVRLSPVLTSRHRMDIDLDLGLGNDDPITMGWYAVDGDVLGVYPILRARGTLLGALDRRGAMGVRLVLETQPLGKTRLGHHEDGSEKRTNALVFRGHQVLAGPSW